MRLVTGPPPTEGDGVQCVRRLTCREKTGGWKDGGVSGVDEEGVA